MRETIKQVEMVFKAIDKEVAALKTKTGVACPEGCVLCCLKPDLEASVLEFMPLALYLVKNNLHEPIIEKIEAGHTICVNLNTLGDGEKQPGCNLYSYRGAICRLFGSAAIFDKKSGKNILYACKTLKEKYAEDWNSINLTINQQKNLPVVADFYTRLYTIDHVLASDYNPINQSIYKAIAKVSLHFSHYLKY